MVEMFGLQNFLDLALEICFIMLVQLHDCVLRSVLSNQINIEAIQHPTYLALLKSFYK